MIVITITMSASYSLIVSEEKKTHLTNFLEKTQKLHEYFYGAKDQNISIVPDPPGNQPVIQMNENIIELVLGLH